MSTVPDAPPESLRYRRTAGVLAAPREIWRARALVRALAEREVRVLYKQALLGVIWVVLTPVTLMIVLTLVMDRVAAIDTHGVPYALFSYVGLVPWNFYASAVSSGGMALVNQMPLLNKLKCPREVFPLASIAVASFNAVVASAVLVVLFTIEGFAPKATTPLLLIPLALQILLTIAVVLVVSSVTVYVRDVRHALPLLLQLAFFATPVAYGIDAVPENLRPAYALANPIAPIIDSYRQTVLYGSAPDWALLGYGALSTVVLLAVAAKVFRRLEMGFADVA